MQERDSFEERINVRVFGDVLGDIDKVVRHKRTAEGWRQFQNRSHYIRAAVMRTLREDLRRLNINLGRPKEYDNSTSDKGQH